MKSCIDKKLILKDKLTLMMNLNHNKLLNKISPRDSPPFGHICPLGQHNHPLPFKLITKKCIGKKHQDITFFGRISPLG